MTIDNIIKYVIGGKAIFTLYSARLDKRYTYKIKVDKKKSDRFYASVLYGPDNCNDYRYLGFLHDPDFTLRAPKSTRDEPISREDPRFRMLECFLEIICTETELPKTCEFYPSTRCARCGRLLTTPESIECGFGPECIKYV